MLFLCLNYSLQPYKSDFFVFLIASKENHAHFGDCAVGVSKQLSFTLTNHSPSDPIRFHWTPPPEITFSPCIGHLQPGCAKDVTVNFISAQPKTLASVNIPCKIVKIKLGETQEKVSLTNTTHRSFVAILASGAVSRNN